METPSGDIKFNNYCLVEYIKKITVFVRKLIILICFIAYLCIAFLIEIVLTI